MWIASGLPKIHPEVQRGVSPEARLMARGLGQTLVVNSALGSVREGGVIRQLGRRGPTSAGRNPERMAPVERGAQVITSRASVAIDS